MQNKGYSNDWLGKLKYNSNIVTIISQYVSLNRKGATYWACCPFHHEKTPSFAVNEQGQFYHCFGCGESGDVIKFVEKMEGVDFIGAVKILAEKAGMVIPEIVIDQESLDKRKHRELLQEICRQSAIYYNKILLSSNGKNGLDYLVGRGVLTSTITKLGLGYSSNWTGIVSFLKSKGYENKDIIESGVCGEKDGRLFDEMANRVVFPVIDHTGKVVGFSGRALEKTAYAKYKNTRATPLFNKSSNIYCVNFLKKARLEKNYAILVEGQMDVVALQQAGFNNAIATMGTAFNKNHVQTLKRFVDAVVVCFDGDSAGQKATVRSLEPLMEEGFEIKILLLPEGLDPDEYIKKYGGPAYQNLIDNALPVYEFEIKHEAEILDLQNKDNIPKFVDNCLNIISDMKLESEKSIYLKLVAKYSGIPVEVINRQLARTPTKVIQTDTETQSQQKVQILDTKNFKAEQFVLASALHKKPYVSGIEVDDFVNNTFREVYKFLLENNFPIVSKLFDSFDVDGDEAIKGLVNFDFSKIENLETEFGGCLAKMQLEKLIQKQNQINAQIGICTDETVKLSLLKSASDISKKIIEKKTLLNKVG